MIQPRLKDQLSRRGIDPRLLSMFRASESRSPQRSLSPHGGQSLINEGYRDVGPLSQTGRHRPNFRAPFVFLSAQVQREADDELSDFVRHGEVDDLRVRWPASFTTHQSLERSRDGVRGIADREANPLRPEIDTESS